jgi:hypothetical protein
MKDVPTDDEVRHSVATAFDKAVEVAGPAVLGALVPHVFEPIPAIHFVPEYETEELCQFVNQLNQYLGEVTNPRETTRLHLLVYCQVMEADLPAAILWNLLRLIAGERPAWTFYTVTAKGKELACEGPEERFAEVARLAERTGMRVGAVLQRLWHNKLRNAFLHAQYSTVDSGDFLGGKNISPLSAKAVRPSDTAAVSGENPYYYTASEVQRLYKGALTWLGVVIDYHRKVARPFKDGAFHQVPTGPVRSDSERGLWMTR